MASTEVAVTAARDMSGQARANGEGIGSLGLEARVVYYRQRQASRIYKDVTMRIIVAAALCLGLSACAPHNPQTAQTVQCPSNLWSLSNVTREMQYPQCW